MPLNINLAALDTLTDSLAFQATLGSKELSHSNILALVLERCPLVATALLGDLQVVRVEREKPLGSTLDAGGVAQDAPRCHADVYMETVLKGVCRHFIVELKVKSLPTLEQMDRYSRSQCVQEWLAASHGVNLVLIAPFAPPQLASGWQFIPFTAVLDAYSSLTDVPGRGYELAFLKDYVDAFRRVFRVLASVHAEIVTVVDAVRWRDVVAFANDELFQRQALRIHDLVQKVCFSALANLIQARLPTAAHVAGWTLSPVEASLANRSKQGLVDICWRSENGLGIGIQIEGKSYRHFISGVRPAEQIPAIAEKWLATAARGPAGSAFALSGLKKRSKHGVRGDPLTYLSSDGSRFVYKQESLPDAYTTNDLLNLIAYDLQQLTELLH